MARRTSSAALLAIVLVVALGVNDANAEISPRDTAANLRAIVASARDQGVAVVLVAAGTAQPRTQRFASVVVDVARERETALVADLLAGVAGVANLNLPDGTHPNAAGQRMLAGNVWSELFRVVVEVSIAEQSGR